jgi:hypothetical protein
MEKNAGVSAKFERSPPLLSHIPIYMPEKLKCQNPCLPAGQCQINAKWLNIKFDI